MSIARISVIFAPVLSLILTLFTGCSETPQKKVSTTEQFSDSTFDNHSYANIQRIRTKHLSLELDVNFENKTVYGIARHEMINSGTDTAIFDLKSLDIQKVTLGKKGIEKGAELGTKAYDAGKEAAEKGRDKARADK